MPSAINASWPALSSNATKSIIEWCAAPCASWKGTSNYEPHQRRPQTRQPDGKKPPAPGSDADGHGTRPGSQKLAPFRAFGRSGAGRAAAGGLVFLAVAECAQQPRQRCRGGQYCPASVAPCHSATGGGDETVGSPAFRRLVPRHFATGGGADISPGYSSRASQSRACACRCFRAAGGGPASCRAASGGPASCAADRAASRAAKCNQ